MRDSLPDRLLQTLESDPGAEAMRLGARSLTRGDVAERARKVAALLVRRGMNAGDRVAVQAPKAAGSVPLYLGVLLAGGVYLPLNEAYTKAEVDGFLDDAEPFALVRDADGLVGEAEDLDPYEGPSPAAGAAPAAIVYTSGTTGRSKGATLSHRALLANAEALVRAWGLSPADVLLHALPIYHVHGLFIALNPTLLAGAPMIWRQTFEASEAAALLPEASLMMGVPTFYTRLLATPEFVRESAASVRLFVSGSAPLSPETFSAFEARTGRKILERYGMSEAGVIASNPLEGERLPGSVGFALEDYEIRIRDGADAGEIEIRGQGLFSGYWRLPEKTREAFTADGFFRTGMSDPWMRAGGSPSPTEPRISSSPAA